MTKVDIRKDRVLTEKRDGWEVGRDPRKVSRDELIAVGHKPMSPMQVIRARCLDCCCHQASEVRKCTAVKCPNWPYRMGTNPWRAAPSEKQLESRRRVGAELARRAKEGVRGIDKSAESDVPATTLAAPKLSTGKFAKE